MSSINVFNEYIDFSYKGTKKLLKIIMEKHYLPKVYDEVFDVYKKVRFFNEYKQIKKDFSSNVDYYLLNKARYLKESGQYNANTVDATACFVNILFLYDAGLMSQDKLISFVDFYRKKYLNLDNEFQKEFITLLNEISSKKRAYFSQFESNVYEVKYLLTNIKKVYNITLSYDLKFPKLYSQFAIDKVFNNDVIGEDKLFIEYYMVLSKILTDVIGFDFSGYYLMEFAVSLLEKDEKFARFLNVIDNDFVKEKLSFKIFHRDFLLNKDKILDLINVGYNFTIIIDDSYEDDGSNREYIKSLFKYIMVDIDSSVYNVFSKFDNIIKIK